MQVTKQNGVKSPVIDLSRSPKVSKWTTLQYWACYLARHYIYGTKHGSYGPPSCVQFMKKIENELPESQKRNVKNTPLFFLGSFHDLELTYQKAVPGNVCFYF